MRPDEYMAFDAADLAELVHRGEVTPQALAEAAIERIDALNPQLNAVVERSFELARSAALQVDLQAPLAGVPFLAKDMNIDVAGLHLTASCRWLSELPAASLDAPLAQRWRAAGLSILGRTNTPEFAEEFVTEPTWRGATRNPWDLTRSPGGSSGGAAAAVASGMVPIAHGTDSGGSIRVPAAACGLVGLKPSRGWVPVGPHLDELAGGLDCEHVLTRSVRDSALMLDLTAGPEPTSRAPVLVPSSGFASALSATVPSLRIGMTLQAPGGLRPNQEIGAAVEWTAGLLARAGHQVKEFAFPTSANIGEPALTIWLTAIAEEIEFYRGRVGRSPEPNELEALTWAAMALGERSSALDYVRARRALTVATRDMAEVFQRFDLLILPTTAELPLRIGQIDGRTAAFDLDRWNSDSYGYAPYTEIFNATGQPAISLPLAMSNSGLPIGVQLAAPLGQDAQLLSLAAWLEREVPWAERLAALRRRYPID
ncbi:MAG TPA: amidase [Steroidobacteraceae bacterium]|nr:amidase [Steroidobacteraceae bacterium]